MGSTLEPTGTNFADNGSILTMNAYLHCQYYHKFQNSYGQLFRETKYTVKLKRKSLDDKKISLIYGQLGAQYVASFKESQSKQILV